MLCYASFLLVLSIFDSCHCASIYYATLRHLIAQRKVMKCGGEMENVAYKQ